LIYGQNSKKCSETWVNRIWEVNSVGRPLGKVAIRKVIESLREGPKSWGELKKLGIKERALSRILTEYLGYWGLVEKTEEGDWIWYEYKRTYDSEREYELAFEHSGKLIEGLDLIPVAVDLGDFFRKSQYGLKGKRKANLAEAFRLHLKTGYPEAYERMIELQDVRTGRERIADEIRQEFPKECRRVLIQSPKDLGPHFLIEYLNRFLTNEGRVPREHRGNMKKIANLIRQDKIDRIKDNKATTTNIYLEFTSEIERIRMKIEHGEPLLGLCDLCPKVSVLPEPQV